MKTDEERGAFGVWLRAQRTAPRPKLPKGWKESEARRRLEAVPPYVSFAVYRDIEAGNRKPTDDQMRAIEAVFGKVPDFTNQAGGAGDTLLPAALKPYLDRIDRLLAQNERLIALLTPTPPPPAEIQKAQDAIDEEPDQEVGTPSPLRSVPPLQSEEPPRTDPLETSTTEPDQLRTPGPS